MAKRARTNAHNVKGAIKPLPSRKIDKKVPLVDCFIAHCTETCPISQDIPEYVALVGQGRSKEALAVITQKNSLPSIAGTICTHRCMDKCTRNFYEKSVCIRDVKLDAAELGFDALLKDIQAVSAKTDAKVAIIGGCPAGISAATFLARAGVDATIFERKDSLGGIVNHVIPDFRIDGETIDHDIALMEALGVTVVTGREIEDVEALKAEGFKYIIVATGAWEPSPYSLEGTQAINVLEFLEDFNKVPEALNLGTDVVVIGGGNTAMDAARVATRVAGVERVHLVYRRTVMEMPADEEELALALEDGMRFYELLSPEAYNGTTLTCREMKLGTPDESGRRRPEPTDWTTEIHATTVIASVGAKIDGPWFEKNGLGLTARGRVDVNSETLMSRDNIFIAGDAQLGTDTALRAIADARKAVNHILGLEGISDNDTVEMDMDYDEALGKRGILAEPTTPDQEDVRCLECSAVCESCMDICHNRANLAITVPHHKMRHIIHVDRMCNECGNCMMFCPYGSAPYNDKFTLFH
ncbi:MAG: FAD-dependent oxidoreductase, partial [Eubacterium aggregans]